MRTPTNGTPTLSTRLSGLLAGLSGNLRGIAWMAASTVAFVGMHGTVRHLSAELHPFEIAFFRQFFGFLALAPWFVRYGLAPLRTRRLPLHALRAGVNLVAMLMFFYALSITPLAQVSALAFTAPIFATVLAMLFLREVVRLRRWLAILVGFSGVFVAFFPDIRQTGGIAPGSLLVVGSALVWAAALILIKMLSRTESSVTTTAYMVLMMMPMSLAVASFYWTWPTLQQLGWLVLAGIGGTLGQMMVAQSLKEGDTNVVMPFDFLKLIWAAALGFLWFGEVPDAFTWMGGAMIFGATTYIAIREHQLRRQRAEPDEPPPVPRTPAAS
ncbi:MAG TPA: DMT family transporter [Alphaproteobacteria bacterium]|nr:DMT family transporter [Alphaproteobacteria bacterium]